MLSIRSFALGPFQTNCYVVRANEADKACWIIDASFQPAAMLRYIQQEVLEPEALILTHAHCDHIAGIPDVKRAFPALPVLIHEAEAAWLGDPERNLSAAFGVPVSLPDADRLLRNGDSLTLGTGQSALNFRVLHTPGHSPGGITLHHEGEQVAFVGDTLFAGSIGRTDFPGSDFDTLARSIRTQLYSQAEQTRVYPGHGPATTIGREAASNPYVSA